VFGSEQRHSRGIKIMPFLTYKTVEDVARAYQITLREEKFIRPSPYPVNEQFQQRLEILLENAPVSVSDEAICEFLIAPILQEIWLGYRDSLMMWSHASFGVEQQRRSSTPSASASSAMKPRGAHATCHPT
jgi:hypothetical protein